MLIVLFLLTSFSLIGEVEHEHLSLGLMAMMFLHLVFTRSNPVVRSRDWTKNIFAISFGLCCLSGVALSRYDLPFFPELNQVKEISTVHFMSAYWCIALGAIHVGEQTKTIVSILPKTLCRIGRIVVYAMSIYGVFVLCTTRFALFLFAGKTFGEADYSVGLGVFFMQLLAVFTLIAVASAYARRLLGREEHGN